VAGSLSIIPTLVSPASATVRPSGTIQLTKATGTPVFLGGTITLRGRFKHGAHRGFVIQKRMLTSRTWRGIASTRGKTNFRGVFKAGYRPRHTYKYRAVLKATATKPMRVSKILKVNVVATWAQVSAGDQHSCGVRTGGTLWCWGDNGNGDLGNGSMYMSSLPVRVTDSAANQSATKTWSSVSAGSDYTCGIRTDGTLWCWGNGAFGVLGINKLGVFRHPQQVGSATDWTSVTTGYADTCGIRSGGSLYCWGANGSGELGIGDASERDTPQSVTGTWSSVAVGKTHTCGIQSDDSLFCWGDDNSGELGQGSTSGSPVTSPTLVDDSSVNTSAAQTWSSVSSGNAYTCGIRTDNSLWCWGDNTNAQLGISSVSTPQTSPVQISDGYSTSQSWLSVTAGIDETSGESHTCGVRDDSTLWCWGYNLHGQLGDGSFAASDAPVQVSDGYVSQSWNVTSADQPSAGSAHTCGIRDDATLWCWGNASGGQLGNGSDMTRKRPSSVVVG
jgi:alpha-tubulin suppressor-like RCC1 family protein